MNPLIILVVIIIALGGFLMVNLYYDNFSGLQLENPELSEIQIKKFNEPTLTFNLHSYENEQVWNNIEVTTEVENSSGKFLKTKNESLGSITLGVDSKRNISLNPFRAISSEGDRITYDAKIIVHANEKTEDTHSIQVSIIENNPLPSKFNLKKEGGLRFENFKDRSFTLDKGEEEFIQFQVKNYQTTNFDDIRVDVFVRNHSGEFLKIEGIQINETLKAKNDITGVIEIPFQALNSEGNEIKFTVDLGLYDGSTLMDTETLDVRIIDS